VPEFTWHGLVRHGFGFYNPNHAAALVCAVLPFLWGWRRRAWIGWLLSAALLVPLALTYSRTGAVVLFLEGAAFVALRGGRGWKRALAAGALALAVLGAFGVLGRFSPDAAVGNRPRIWRAGLALCAANPGGVGLGSSGALASAFLLDGIRCRTLVNAHLTLLAEQGAAAGFAWFLFLSAALLGGRRHPAAWCSVAGLALSCCLSTVFDGGVLFDGRDYGGTTAANFALSWATLLLCLVLCALLAANATRRDWFVAVVASAFLAVILPRFFADPDAPRVRNGCVVSTGPDAPLVLYDRSWTLKTLLPHLSDGYVLPLDPGDRPGDFSRIWYFGDAAEYSANHPAARHTFFFPSEFFQPPPGTERIVKD
jgi:hypothetical protein